MPTYTGAYSVSGPLVRWLGFGYCPGEAHEDSQEDLEENPLLYF